MTDSLLLFVDLESSDLIRRDARLDDPDQPWIVTLAAALCDRQGDVVDFFYRHIRADGRKIAAGAQAVHGISSRQAAVSGGSEITALGMLLEMAEEASCVVGYGLSFDRDVVTSVLMRRGKNVRRWLRPGLEFINLMEPATALCKIASGHESGSYKWPTLDEACQIVLGMEPRTGEHNAWDDINRTRALFLRMVELDAVEITA